MFTEKLLFYNLHVALCYSDFWDTFQADWQAIAIPQEISLPRWKRKHSFVCGCCVVKTCRNKFKDLPERIMKSEPYAVFELGHENISSEMVHTVPDTLKWHNFLFDLSDFRTQHFFNNKDFTSNIGVNGLGHSKVFAHWRVLEKNQGRWGNSLTCNVIDITISVPELNLVFSDHFCYRFFPCSRGSPHTLIPMLLQEVVSAMYAKYYNKDGSARNEKTLLCTNCDHKVDEGPSEDQCFAIPEWYCDAIYKDTGLTRVSDFLYSLDYMSRSSDYTLINYDHMFTEFSNSILHHQHCSSRIQPARMSSKFVLKDYKPLDKDTVGFWYDMVDIIGPVRNWPPKIRNLFFRKNITHSQLFQLSTFIFVNGVNPDMLLDLVDRMVLCSSEKSHCEFVSLLTTFETNPKKYAHMYAYNVYVHHYEYLNGRIKFYLPGNILHPW